MARVMVVSWLAQSSVASRPRRRAARPIAPTRTTAARPPNNGQLEPVDPSSVEVLEDAPAASASALGVGAGIVTSVSGLAAAAGTGSTAGPQPAAGQPSMPQVSPFSRRNVAPAATRTSEPVAFSGTATQVARTAGGSVPSALSAGRP